MKKIILPLLLSICYIFIFAIIQNVSAEGIQQNVFYNIDNENPENVFVDHRLRIVGISDEQLRSSIELDIPYDKHEIKKVEVDNKEIIFDSKNNSIYFGLGKRLRRGEFVDVKINYEIYNVGKKYVDTYYYDFINPSDSSYGYNIAFNNEKFNLGYINSPDKSLSNTFDKDIKLVLKESKVSNFSYQIEYTNTDSSLIYPIISENINSQQFIQDISGAEVGYIDEYNNYYLIPNKSGNIKLTGTTTLDKEPNLTTERFFEDQNFGMTSYTELVEIIKEKYEPSRYQEELPLGLEEIISRKDLSPLEYSIIFSDQLSLLEIPNRVIYGMSKSPYGELDIHYWVLVEIDNSYEIYDIYLDEVLEDSSKRDLLYIPFGVIGKDLAPKISIIEKIANLSVNSLEQIKNIDVEKSMLIEFLPSNDQNLDLIISNKGNTFSYVTDSTDQAIFSQLQGKLFLPGKNYNQKIFIESEDLMKKFELTYSNGNEEIERSYSISLNDRKVYYLKVFAISFLILIPITFFGKFFIRKLSKKVKKTDDFNLR